MRLIPWLFVFVLLAPVTAAQMPSEANLVELSSYETRYGDYGRYRGRAHNIRHATTMITGTIVQPGQMLSFNETIGERTRQRGFQLAPVITAGRIDKDYGGGICQLASTIHIAALYAGLEIVERHPHSRTLGYVNPGFDATVDWSTNKDLVIRNPFPYSIKLLVTNRVGNQSGERFVAVKIMAGQQTHVVEIRASQSILEQFETIYVPNSNLQTGTQRVIEPGTPKMYVSVHRKIRPANAEESSTETFETVYQASNRIIQIGISN